MFITDLDGTLTSGKGHVSEENLNSLQHLGKKNILRVIATGRTVHSAKKVLDKNFPIDYLIFSSGAGIISWHDEKLLSKIHINKSEIEKTKSILDKFKVDYAIHAKIPENHFFYYKKVNNNNSDFNIRINKQSEFALPLTLNNDLDVASQFVVMFQPGELDTFFRIKEEIDFLKVIRATSPVSHKTTWMEIFNPAVSKGSAAAWLTDLLNIDKSKVVCIGNDYNDIDLLNWATLSYVVEDSPLELKTSYKVTSSSSDHGVSKVIEEYL